MDTSTRKTILARVKVDQAMREKVAESGDMTIWEATVDRDNTAYLKTIVDEHGWPRISDVGMEVSQATWLLAQHADHDLQFQLRCLELMKTLPSGDVSLQNIAYLEDRVRVAQGRPQLYGTQFIREGDNLIPQPIQDEVDLDRRRQAMGLESFESNMRRISERDK